LQRGWLETQDSSGVSNTAVNKGRRVAHRTAVESAGGSLVIGPKKLGTVREELHRALAATSDDPIHWLEERMTSVELQGSAVPRENEVLISLRRFIEARSPAKSRKRRAGLEK
jgi:hypothetical protein